MLPIRINSLNLGLPASHDFSRPSSALTLYRTANGLERIPVRTFTIGLVTTSMQYTPTRAIGGELHRRGRRSCQRAQDYFSIQVIPTNKNPSGNLIPLGLSRKINRKSFADSNAAPFVRRA